MIRKKWIFITIIFISVFFVWIYVINENPNSELTVSFLDVGQGDAIFIEAPNNNQILIDGGDTRDSVLRELRKVMPFYDRSIDVIVATHPDSDHIGGLVSVLDRFFVGLFIKTNAENDTNTYKELKKKIEENNVEVLYARAGNKIYLDDEVILEILFPDKDVQDFESNTGSIVMKLSYFDSDFLFMSDSPKNIEEYLVSLYQDKIESEVLKTGHHGSNTSSSNIFIAKVNPDYAVISSGYDNRYGHPHKEVLEILEQFDIKVLNTSNQGTIIFTSDGYEIKLK